MTVKELMLKLSEFPQDMPVHITDGYECVGWFGDFEVKEFEGVVDIGIGGLRE